MPLKKYLWVNIPCKIFFLCSDDFKVPTNTVILLCIYPHFVLPYNKITMALFILLAISLSVFACFWLPHNLHSFRPQATTKNGQPIWKKHYSKRTKRWHSEPIKAEKSYDYVPHLMASILKARVEDQESAGRVVSLPENHPRNLAATIALWESSELDLV